MEPYTYYCLFNTERIMIINMLKLTINFHNLYTLYFPGAAHRRPRFSDDFGVNIEH